MQGLVNPTWQIDRKDASLIGDMGSGLAIGCQGQSSNSSCVHLEVVTAVHSILKSQLGFPTSSSCKVPTFAIQYWTNCLNLLLIIYLSTPHMTACPARNDRGRARICYFVSRSRARITSLSSASTSALFRSSKYAWSMASFACKSREVRTLQYSVVEGINFSCRVGCAYERAERTEIRFAGS